jgi:uncharacterized protein (DUF302 family)
MSKTLVTPFDAVRIRIESHFTFEQLVKRLLEQIGDQPVKLDKVAEQNSSWESYLDAVVKLQGPGGFMLFGLIDHGAWVSKTGLSSNALRVLFGNPLVAITILKHDLTAGLFVPVECLVLAERHGRSSITYIQPSSLIALDGSPGLLGAARALDLKLENLFEYVCNE